MRNCTSVKTFKTKIKIAHPKWDEYMYRDRGAKDFERLGLDLEATKGLA